MLFSLLCHHVVDFGHPAAKRFGLHVALHSLDGVVDDTAVFHLKKITKWLLFKNSNGFINKATLLLL
jgi:hypothetical protein